MHEVAIVEGIIELVTGIGEENKLKNVEKVNLVVGEYRGVLEDSIIFAFNALKGEGMLKNAEINIEKIKAEGFCYLCNKNFYLERKNKICPYCSGTSFKIVKGYELYIKSIEGE